MYMHGGKALPKHAEITVTPASQKSDGVASYMSPTDLALSTLARFCTTLIISMGTIVDMCFPNPGRERALMIVCGHGTGRYAANV